MGWRDPFVDARIVEEADIVARGFALESFFNLNTERDYARALELVSARAGRDARPYGRGKV